MKWYIQCASATTDKQEIIQFKIRRSANVIFESCFIRKLLRQNVHTNFIFNVHFEGFPFSVGLCILYDTIFFVFWFIDVEHICRAHKINKKILLILRDSGGFLFLFGLNHRFNKFKFNQRYSLIVLLYCICSMNESSNHVTFTIIRSVSLKYGSEFSWINLISLIPVAAYFGYLWFVEAENV